jgi:hypothetical protein
MRPQGHDEDVVRPTREEIERLCLLHVVADGASSGKEIAEALGLARELAPALELAIQPCIDAGQMEHVGAMVRVTETGRDWMVTRLSELGVR